MGRNLSPDIAQIQTRKENDRNRHSRETTRPHAPRLSRALRSSTPCPLPSRSGLFLCGDNATPRAFLASHFASPFPLSGLHRRAMARSLQRFSFSQSHTPPANAAACSFFWSWFWSSRVGVSGRDLCPSGRPSGRHLSPRLGVFLDRAAIIALAWRIGRKGERSGHPSGGSLVSLRSASPSLSTRSGSEALRAAPGRCPSFDVGGSLLPLAGLILARTPRCGMGLGGG